MVVATEVLQPANSFYMPKWLSVVLPEETENLITNPSVETNTTGFAAVGAGATIARTLSYQRRGAYALQINPANAVASGAYFGTIALTAGQAYTFSLDVLGVAGHVYNIYFATTAGVQLGSPFEFTGQGRWQRVHITYVETSTTTRRVYIVQDASNTQAYYIDGLQVEAKSYPTTYCDGDLEGFVDNEFAYRWNGTDHASTSIRLGTTRSGGKIVPLTDYGFELVGITDLGMPPIENFSTPLNTGGAYYQNTIESSRRFNLLGDISATASQNLMRFRKNLESAFAYNLTPYRQPFLLHMQQTDESNNPISESIFIKCLYDSGLEGVTDNYFNEKLNLQFVAYEKEAILAEGNKALELDYKDVFKNASVMIESVQGEFSGFDASLSSGYLADVLYASDGTIYATGAFTTIGGISANYIAKYSDGVWSALGSGFDAAGYCLVEAPNGDIYAGGTFTTAGGGAALRIAVWNGSSWAAVGAGLDNTVTDMEFTGDGDLIITGSFSNVAGGGIACAKIVKWNGTAYSALGSGLSATGNVIRRELSSNIMYIGFGGTTAGGVTVNYICKLDVDGPTYTALGAGANSSVNQIELNANKTLLVLGTFTTIGGISAQGYAEWNGSQWSVPLTFPVAPTGTGFGYDIRSDRGYLGSSSGGNVFTQNNVQIYGIIGHTGGTYPFKKVIPSGAVISWQNTIQYGVRTRAKNDLPLEHITNGKMVVGTSIDSLLFHMVGCRTTYKLASLYKTLSAGEKLTIYSNPLRCESNYLGDITDLFYAGSLFQIPEYGANDIVVYATDNITITNDGANQIGQVNYFKGLNESNTNAGVIYITIVDDGGGNFHVNIYSDAGRTALIAHTASVAGVGPTDQAEDLIEDNDSGVSGIIVFSNLSAADADIYATVSLVTCYFQYNQYFSSIYEALYG